MPANLGDSPRSERDSAGRAVGRYNLLTKLASGGMASVYLARATGMGGFQRVVAVKVCHPHLVEDRDFALMFLDEAKLAARIHHPNVVPVLDVGRDEILYLVMEYVDGDRLSELLRATANARETLPLPVALRIVSDMLAGLHAAHELHDEHGAPLELIHRDVSPQNVLVGVDGVTRLTDFGIAKAATNAVVTQTGQVKGKLSYMAPEQFRGAALTRRIDVFAAGVVLWEAITGRRLFAGESDAETSQRILSLPIAPPSSVVPGIPSELDEVVRRALDRNVDARFPSAQAFADAIEACGVPIASTRTVANEVAKRLGARLDERRAKLQRLLRDEAPPSEDAQAGQDLASQLKTLGSPRAEVEGVPASTAVERPRSSSRPALVGVAVLVLSLALAAGGVAWMRAGRSNHRTSRADVPLAARAAAVVVPPATTTAPDAGSRTPEAAMAAADAGSTAATPTTASVSNAVATEPDAGVAARPSHSHASRTHARRHDQPAATAPGGFVPSGI